jgi:hypothetical protein
MEASLPSDKPLPDGVSDADLYEGPKIVPLASGKAAFIGPAQAPSALGNQPIPPPAQALIQPIPQPPPVPTAAVKSAYPDLIRLCLDVLATKVHALWVLTAAIAIWGYSAVNPDPWRLLAATAYSVLVVLPMLLIYWRSGTKGEGE